MNNITPKSSTPGMPLIVFKVGKMTCAVDGASVISIQRMEEFTLTPHTPDEIFPQSCDIHIGLAHRIWFTDQNKGIQ